MFINFATLAHPVQTDNISSFFHNLKIEIAGFGTWRKTEGRSIHNAIVSEYELCYLMQGELKIIIQNKEFICQSGSLFLLEPFTPYSVEKLSKSSDYKIYNIFFDFTEDLDDLNFRKYILPSDRPLWKQDELPDLSAFFCNIYSLCKKNAQGKLIFVTSLLNICFMYMANARITYCTNKNNNLYDVMSSRLKHKIIIVKKAISYIKKNINEPFSIYELSHEIGISESYLYKCFIDVLNSPPQKIYNSL